MEHVSFSCTFDDESSVLSVRGEVDIRDATVLGDDIAHHGRQGPMSLDLSQVTYLSSDALGIILRSQIAARKDGRPIEIWARSGSIAHEILRVGGVPHLDLHEDPPDGPTGDLAEDLPYDPDGNRRPRPHLDDPSH